MSDEENEAIEYWKTHMEILHWNTQLASEHYIKVLLDLIEKQQKEIEELKEENKEIREWKYVIDNPIDLKKLSELDIIKIFGKSYIAKDLIKAKIEEYKKQQKEEPDAYLCIKVLQSLLEKE